MVNSCTPSPCSQLADSQATTPPPTTATRRGTSCRLVTSREVQGSAARSPGRSGTLAVVPVASTTACRAVMIRVAPSAPVTSTCFGPASRPCPRTTPIPVSLAHCTWYLSSWWLVNPSRRSSTAGTSMVRPATREATPGMCRAASSSSTGRSSALLGMQAQ